MIFINKNYMNKRILVSESEKREILKMHNKAKSLSILNEETLSGPPERQFIRAVQRFLNEKKLKGMDGKIIVLVVDGKTGRGSKTEEAISQYQSSIGVYPADGDWGANTWEKMPKEDEKRLKKLIADEGDWLDKIFNYFGID
jgi:hypothetical protein